MDGQKSVAIYTTPTCGFCKMAKAFFRDKDIVYTEYSVMEDVAARTAMLDKSGQSGVPVIDVGGELVIGFDQSRLEELLGL